MHSRDSLADGEVTGVTDGAAVVGVGVFVSSGNRLQANEADQ